MKQILFCAFAAIIFLMACTKNSNVPKNAPLSTATSSSDDGTASTLGNRTKKLLTAHAWMYSKYYIEYVDSLNPGRLIYKAGRQHNAADFSKSRITYNEDGTVTETDSSGADLPGTWVFFDKSKTSISTTNATGTYVWKIISLSRRDYHWQNETDATSGFMVPAN